MSKKNVKFYIKNNTYFETLAKTLNLVLLNINNNNSKQAIKIAKRRIDDLMFLQNNYRIQRKT